MSNTGLMENPILEVWILSSRPRTAGAQSAEARNREPSETAAAARRLTRRGIAAL
jgi:hypothetical protein